MLRAISSGNRVDEKSGVQHTPTPFYQPILLSTNETCQLKIIAGVFIRRGKGVPSNLLEPMVRRPVTRRKEPLQQFLETPYGLTVGSRRVRSRSNPTGSNPLSNLGADVKKELSTKKKGISIREIEPND